MQRNAHQSDYHIIRKSFENKVRKLLTGVQRHFEQHSRYEGEGYGVGLSIGKAYQIGRRWNLEWEAGAGAVWLAYDKYLCKRCGDLVGQEYGWHFLPTRAALNVVYLF